MSDLIDRQAAIEACENTPANSIDAEKGLLILNGLGRACDVIKAIPAANVVPVRLGEWLDGYKMQTCSLCKCRGKKSWTFCPHCGARMIYGKREE